MKNILAGLHKAFESRVRLGIMSALAVQEQMDFNALKDALEVTDGNLASHLKALEKEAFIKVHKQFVGRKPQTSYKATSEGKKAFEEHLKHLEALIRTQQ